MSFDYSFRINDRMYGINDESLGSTLGDFLEHNTITFSNKSERLGTMGGCFFLPITINLVKHVIGLSVLILSISLNWLIGTW